jgi:hypothetical protein
VPADRVFCTDWPQNLTLLNIKGSNCILTSRLIWADEQHSCGALALIVVCMLLLMERNALSVKSQVATRHQEHARQAEDCHQTSFGP